MKKTDEKQNPLHREYGLMSNIRWTLSAMRQHSKGLLTLIPDWHCRQPPPVMIWEALLN